MKKKTTLGHTYVVNNTKKKAYEYILREVGRSNFINHCDRWLILNRIVSELFYEHFKCSLDYVDCECTNKKGEENES